MKLIYCEPKDGWYPFVSQDGRDQYELAATSEQASKKKSKAKKKEKDMDELKKEVDLVSYWYLTWL